MIFLYGWIGALDLDLPASAVLIGSASMHLKSLSILGGAYVRGIDSAIRSGSILRLA